MHICVAGKTLSACEVRCVGMVIIMCKVIWMSKLMNKTVHSSVNVGDGGAVLKSMGECIFVQGHVYRRLLWACISVSFDCLR